MEEFTTPAFLLNRSPDDLQSIGLKALPADIDVSEGSHAWNFTRSAALIAAEICEFVLPEVVKLIFPEWSYGEYLVTHARARAMEPLTATAATGEITITGDVGTVIPAGSLFVTSTINDEPSAEYKTMEEVSIPEGGSVTVAVECTHPGIDGNTAANTVVHSQRKISGIKAVTNENVITGGTEEEDDEALIERILDYDRSLGDSFVGSVADYKRWAESVDGVGTAEVIPVKDTSGLVTIFLMDANGNPANEALCEAVYNYIMSPNDENARLAPPCVELHVDAPQTVTLTIEATVELAGDATIESVRAAFLTRIAEYLPEAMNDGEIRYSRITRELSQTPGVYDYKAVAISYAGARGATNVIVADSDLPIVNEDSLILTAGTV